MGRSHRHLLVIIVGLTATLLLAGAAPARTATVRAPGQSGAERAAARFVPRQALVRFHAGLSLSAMRRTAIANDAHVAEVLRGVSGRAAIVRSASLSTSELVDALEADPRVERAEPDYLVHLDATPNDPDLPSLWGLLQIRAPGAWDLTTGSPSVVLASVDTGVDYAHPDLAANMWHNPGEIAANGLDDDGNGYVDDIYGIASASDAVDPSDPMDVQGHGTHTAGTMAGVGDNSAGVTGVAWRASIMALRFFSADGLGATSDAIACIDYAVAMKQRGVNVVAINASWGDTHDSAFLRYAIESAGDAGIIVVAAAGNGGGDKIGDDNDAAPYYPASFDSPNVVAVAASDSADTLTQFSNYGAASVDLAAPGAAILSTVPTSTDPSGYAFKNGTSMAAPHVTGTLALIAALYPDESVAERIGRLLASADPVAALTGRCVTGGRLDAWGAVDTVAPVAPVIVDTAAPVTTAVGIDGAWHPSAVVVSFSAVDAGSGVASIEYSLDDGPWTQGTTCTIGGDGAHKLSYHAVDVAGNAETVHSATVLVDTGRPATQALAKVSVRRGRRATLRFIATDVTPRAAFAIRVYRNRRHVRTLRVGERATNAPQRYSWVCRLAKGTYTWRVYATDLAGNRQGKTGSRRLVVR